MLQSSYDHWEAILMHEKFLQIAVELALESVMQNNGGPFGTVITKDKTIIATGINLVTTTNDPTAHAEIVAIRAACKKRNDFQLDGCIVYSSCEPCPMCFGALYWARPEAIYFASSRNDAADIGFDDSFIYEQIALPVSQRTLTMKQLTITNHIAPFMAWSKKKEKKEY